MVTLSQSDRVFGLLNAAPAGAGGTVLVVDDQPVQGQLTGRLAERVTGLRPIYASDGREALEFLERASIAAVVTDLHMPGMDGLELVGTVRGRLPSVPVIPMTAHGSEEIAVRALTAGAASYVPKRDMKRKLAGTLKRVLAVAAADGRRRKLAGAVVRRETEFQIENDPELLEPLVEQLLEDMGSMGYDDTTARVRVGVALQESLLNSLYHEIGRAHV